MNKESFLDCHFNKFSNNKNVKKLFCKKSQIFTPYRKEPENLKIRKESLSSTLSVNSEFSSLDEDNSFEFELSKKNVKNIFNNKMEHFPFTEIEKQHNKGKFKWFVRNQSWKVVGPFNSNFMDKIFQNGVIGKDSKIRSFTDLDFYPLNDILKKYTKIIKKRKKKKYLAIVENAIKNVKDSEDLFQSEIPHLNIEKICQNLQKKTRKSYSSNN